jgi:hypothetical protein
VYKTVRVQDCVYKDVCVYKTVCVQDCVCVYKTVCIEFLKADEPGSVLELDDTCEGAAELISEPNFDRYCNVFLNRVPFLETHVSVLGATQPENQEYTASTAPPFVLPPTGLIS